MAAVLNPSLFSNEFSSQSLGVLAALTHNMRDEGQYAIHIKHRGRVVRSIGLVVSKELSQAPAQSLDLSEMHKQGPRQDEQTPSLDLKPNGILAFFVTSGTAHYSVQIDRDAGLDGVAGVARVYDSSSLEIEDTYSLTLVRPEGYVAEVMHQEKPVASLRIEVTRVSQPAEGSNQEPKDPSYVRASIDGFYEDVFAKASKEWERGSALQEITLEAAQGIRIKSETHGIWIRVTRSDV